MPPAINFMKQTVEKTSPEKINIIIFGKYIDILSLLTYWIVL